MKFEVNKFLALTAALATAAAAAAGCSSTDKKNVEDVGGAGNTAGASGATDEPTAGTNAGGDTAAGQGGASEGGASGASEGGAAGAGFECIADLVGAGGASDESGPCDFWYGSVGNDCSDETNHVGNLCYDIYGLARPAVVAAFNDCASALTDKCDDEALYACAGVLVGKGCEQDATAVTCAAIETTCEGASQCAKTVDLLLPESAAYITDCMDPTGESFDVTFDGTCDERLLHCAKLTIPPPAI